jgi:hypothetical protein
VLVPRENLSDRLLLHRIEVQVAGQAVHGIVSAHGAHRNRLMRRPALAFVPDTKRHAAGKRDGQQQRSFDPAFHVIAPVHFGFVR